MLGFIANVFSSCVCACVSVSDKGYLGGGGSNKTLRRSTWVGLAGSDEVTERQSEREGRVENRGGEKAEQEQCDMLSEMSSVLGAWRTARRIALGRRLCFVFQHRRVLLE